MGYVNMPEHVHLLLSEPERTTLAVAIQMLKQIVGKKLSPADRSPSGNVATMTATFIGTMNL